MLISNGNDLSFNIEYIERDELFCKLKINKASKRYADNRIFDFSRPYSFNDFIDVIDDKKHLLEESDFEYKLETSSDYVLHLRNERAAGQKIVKEFVNSNGMFYVPGSSIKGTLATILGRDSIGIDKHIKEKFVILDSGIIPQENFSVLRTYRGRPPLNLICMNAGVDFEIVIRKMGDVKIDQLRESIATYYKKQIDTAINYVKEYVPKDRAHRESGAEIYLAQLEELKRSLNEDFGSDKYLINIGFGSGTYFKLFKNVTKIPTFFNRKTRQEEEPHTTFSFFDGEYADHIGWCKLKIEK